MNIGIVGLGLIGGSLGLDLRSLGHYVIGVSRRESTCQKAIAIGSVDEASVDLSIMAGTELIVICTPIANILPTLEQLIPQVSSNTVITDVGSVKAPIVQKASSLWNNFIGGHPMAGTADSGIEAAVKNLFVKNPYVITPIDTTNPTAIALLEEIIKQLKAIPLRCYPKTHDKAVSSISHLPVMVSASLIKTCILEADTDVAQLSKNLASSGFRDTSRVGGGNPELGIMMAKYNRQALLESLQSYQHNLEELINLVEKEDWEQIDEYLQVTKKARPLFIK
ncbi:MAG: prephenate/arogenate dehydrogenase [Cyanobacteria bacterium P01_A01_bin.84]